MPSSPHERCCCAPATTAPSCACTVPQPALAPGWAHPIVVPADLLVSRLRASRPGPSCCWNCAGPRDEEVLNGVSSSSIRTKGGQFIPAEVKPVFSHWNLPPARTEGGHATGMQGRGRARSARSRARRLPSGCGLCAGALTQAGRHHVEERRPGSSPATRMAPSCSCHPRSRIKWSFSLFGALWRQANSRKCG